MSMEWLRDHEAERLVLGLVLERPDRAEESGLAPDDFDDGRNATLWQAILHLAARRVPVTEETLFQRLRDAKAMERAGGEEYVQALLMASSGLAGFREQVGRVKDRATRRRTLAALQEASEAIRDTARPAFEVVGATADALSGLSSDGADEPQHLGAVTRQVLEDMKAARRGEMSTYIKTGIRAWDERLGGLSCGQSVWVGAQPRVGKSGVAVTMGMEIAAGSRPGAEEHRPSTPVLVFSLEDPATFIPRRALALYARTSIRNIRTGELSEYQERRVEEEATRFGSLPLWIHDAEGVTVRKAVAIARRMVRRHGVRVVLVDHLLELVPDQGHNRLARDERIGEVVAALRDLAKNTRTPEGQPISVMVLAHFKRPERFDADPKYKEPHLSDFAGSAFVERRARVAVGLYRPRPPEAPGDGATQLERDEYERAMEHAERTIFCKVLKQTEGSEGCDFALQLYAPSGAVDPRLGGPLNDKGGFTAPHPEDA